MPNRTVRNINGTSKGSYQISGLKAKYHAAVGHSVSNCQVRGCGSKATATAHVIHASSSSSNTWYATAMCAKHNHTSNHDPMTLKKDAPVKRISSLRNK
jgi:hypothetical protein